MSDLTVNAGAHHVKRVHKAEFFVYFALIFSLALPLHVLGWSFQALRDAKLPRLTPLSRAWKDARAVTPMIFRG